MKNSREIQRKFTQNRIKTGLDHNRIAGEKNNKIFHFVKAHFLREIRKDQPL